MRTLITTLMLLLFTSQTQAVTYQSTGTFTYGDGGTWTATAIFPESEMTDLVVHIAEMTSFTVVTSPGSSLPGRTYNRFDDDMPTLNGLRFDGPLAGATVLGPPMESTERAYFTKRFNNGSGRLYLTATHTDEYGVNSGYRLDLSGPVWFQILDPISVPEPLTASLIPLALAPLFVRRRRAA